MGRPGVYARLLDAFEAKHGTWHELLDQYACGDESRDRELRRLMHYHDKLVWAQMGYVQGLEDARRPVGEPGEGEGG